MYYHRHTEGVTRIGTKKGLPIIAALIFAMILVSCGGNLAENKVYSAEDVNGRTVGVIEGSAAESLLSGYGGSVSVNAYGDAQSLADALHDGFVDCAICGDEISDTVVRSASGLTALDESFATLDYRIAMSAENKQLQTQLNTAIAALSSDSTLKNIIGSGKAGELMEIPRLTEGALITVAVDPTFAPYSYYDENGNLAGIEINLVNAICGYLGLTVEYNVVSPDMLMYMASSGKVSFAIGRITEDAGDDVIYSDVYDTDNEIIIVRKG